MEELDQKQKNKIEKLALLEEDKDLALFEEVQTTNELLTEIRDKEMPEHKTPEVMKVKIEGIEVITLKGEKGDKPTDEEIISLIKPLIPEPINGEDYVLTENDKKEIAKSITVPVVEKVIEKTEVIKEQPIITNEIKEVAKYETGEQIIEKINSDETSKIKKEKVEGLDDEFNAVRDTISNIPRGGGSRGVQLYVDGGKKGMVNMINLIPGSGVTLNYSSAYGRNDITISASGGSFAILTATGTIDDTNLDFTFISKPAIIVVNGASYIENVGWTWNSGTLTATLLTPPVGVGGNLYGIG